MSGHEHRDLVALFDDFRASLAPDVVEGVPDYTHAAMGRKHAELLRLQERLTTLDISAWSLSEQVDYHVVRAEMNGVDFDHRVLRPWARDAGFYNIIDGIYPRLLVHHSRMLSDWPLDAPQLPLSDGQLATLPDQAPGNPGDLRPGARQPHRSVGRPGPRGDPLEGKGNELHRGNRRAAGPRPSGGSRRHRAGAGRHRGVWRLADRAAPVDDRARRSRQGQLQLVAEERVVDPLQLGRAAHCDPERIPPRHLLPAARGASQPRPALRSRSPRAKRRISSARAPRRESYSSFSAIGRSSPCPSISSPYRSTTSLAPGGRAPTYARAIAASSSSAAIASR